MTLFHKVNWTNLAWLSDMLHFGQECHKGTVQILRVPGLKEHAVTEGQNQLLTRGLLPHGLEKFSGNATASACFVDFEVVNRL